VVVDGHPVPDGLAFVNMSDVESVEVLKDAASAAIYGSRGAGGVILITTKSGKTDKPSYSLQFSLGNKNPYKLYPIISTTDYTNLLYSEAALRAADTGYTNYATTAQRNANYNLITSAEKAAYLIENDPIIGSSTDWQKAALRNGLTKNLSLSVSGGSKNLKYYLAGAYQSDPGMIIHSEYERFNVRSKIEAQLSKKVKLNININPSYFKRERPSTSFTDFTRVTSYLPLRLNAAQAAFISQNPAYASVVAGDYAQPRMFNDLPYSGIMPDGKLFTSTGALSVSSSANNSPYSILQTEKITSDDYRILSSADLTINILPGLDFKTLVSAYLTYTNGLDFSQSNSSAAGAVSRGVYTNRLYFDLLNENTFNYTKKIKDHSINVLAGFTAQKTRVNNQQAIGLNYQSDNITTLNTALSIDQPNTFNTVTKIGLLSYLGRITYGYADKYLLAASYRTDGSSYFGPGHKWGSFPSVSVGWVASKEKFMTKVDWLNNLKFRGSYGATGNNRIVDYGFVDLLYPANYPFGAANGTVTQGVVSSSTLLANPDITWERTFSYNGGVDLAMFKNAVTLSLDIYHTITEKLLLYQAAMGFTGVPQTLNNIGKVQNNGIELEITTNNLKMKNFRWTTSGNISHNKNKIIQLGNEAFLLNTGERQDVYMNQVGGPIIQYFNLKTDGIWLSQADVNAAIAKGMTSSLSGYFTPGGLKFVDENGDNKIDLNDRIILGNPYPDFNWGLTNNFKFKDFDFSFTFQGSQGGKVLNGDAFYNEARKYNANFNANRWISPMYPGDGKTPYFTNGYTNAWTQSDYIIEDASYYALREVLLGYTLPAKLTKKFSLSSMRLYFSAQNPYYHFASKYNGINPEARNSNGVYNTPLIDGYQRGAFPINETVLFGVNLNF
jgi:TonB-linked SusC/RagA family outer membrane protein